MGNELGNDIAADVSDFRNPRNKSVAHLKITAAEIDDDGRTPKFGRMLPNQCRHLFDIRIKRNASRTNTGEEFGLPLTAPKTVFVDIPEDPSAPLLLAQG
jgi:hypothetical protein